MPRYSARVSARSRTVTVVPINRAGSEEEFRRTVRGELPAPTHAQRLILRFADAAMRLFDRAMLVYFPERFVVGTIP